MPLFALICIDKPGALAVRMEARPRHLTYVEGLGERLKLAGPFLDEQGEMCGSLLIVDVDDLAAARAINADDPYTRAGLWERVEVRGFRGAIGGR